MAYCEVTVNDIYNKVSKEITSTFPNYQLRKDGNIFIPQDIGNKNFLGSQLQKTVAGINREYLSYRHGKVVNVYKEPYGYIIDISPKQELADAMTAQNYRDEVGDDFYMGDDALREQEELQNKQFQKLTTEEKARTIEQVTKEHRSITALKDLSAKLAHRIGGKVTFENNPNANWKGYNQGMTSVLNEAYMTPDTPFHEILAHPIIRAIKNKNLRTTSEGISDFSQSKLYQSLLKELETGRGKEVFEQVKRDYPISKITYDLVITKDGVSTTLDTFNTEEEAKENNAKNNYQYRVVKRTPPQGIFTEENQQEEAIVTLLGMMAADKLDAKKDASLISKLKELWKQISDFVKSLLRQDGIKIDELPITTTLNDLAEIMAYGNNKIILPGYKVEYSTPLGNKYDTLEEVNNEIRGLADGIINDIFLNENQETKIKEFLNFKCIY